MGLGEEDHRGKGPFAFQAIQGPSLTMILIAADIDLDHLAAAVFVSFLQVKIFPSFSCCPLWKEVAMHSPHLRKRSNCPNPWGWSTYINHVEFFYVEGLSVFLYLFIESCIYIGVCSGVLLWTLTWLYFVGQVVIFGHWGLFSLALGPLHQPRHGVLLCLLNPSSLSGTKRCSRFQLV